MNSTSNGNKGNSGISGNKPQPKANILLPKLESDMKAKPMKDLEKEFDD